ncbi:MAG TPA: metallophosphoesterase family protein [Kiritimatiellia bacterium]|nr:metallophosphoesterase family protein [Kiritimatiellia bacterium]HMO99531.1 metallophosphoesterase family protein [Kiritimatiellia bacterium]
MIIGILSDTHGDVRRTAKAIALLKAHQPEHILHCGDLGSFDVLAELAAGFMEPRIPVTCVLGNVDNGNDDLMSPWPHVRIEGRFARLTLGGKRIALIHGDDFLRLRQACESGDYDMVCTGHTHQREDSRHGQTRIINPGALHRTREPGCAVLDLATGALTFLDV